MILVLDILKITPTVIKCIGGKMKNSKCSKWGSRYSDLLITNRNGLRTTWYYKHKSPHKIPYNEIPNAGYISLSERITSLPHNLAPARCCWRSFPAPQRRTFSVNRSLVLLFVEQVTFRAGEGISGAIIERTRASRGTSKLVKICHVRSTLTLELCSG